MSEEIALTSSNSALQLSQIVFETDGKLHQIIPVCSTAPTVGTNVTGVTVGVRNPHGGRSTESDADYFVTSCTLYRESAKKKGIGAWASSLTLAATDIKKGDILTFTNTGLANSGSIRLKVWWETTGYEAHGKSAYLPEDYTDTTT